MNEVEKFLRKIGKSERAVLLSIIDALSSRQGRAKYHATKLKGSDYYRVCHGKYRIIFHLEDDIAVIDATRLRNEKTYRNI